MKLFKAFTARCIRWIWPLMPNCGEMSRLASRSFEQRFSLITRLKMRLHYLVCVWCQRYQKQLSFLHKAIHDHPEKLSDTTPARLSPEARERLKRKLRSQSD